MYDRKIDHIDEAKRIVKIVDENQLDKEDYLFFLSIKKRIEFNGSVSDRQIYWLRDIKDKQL